MHMIDTQDLCRSGEFLPAHLTEVSVGPAECGGLAVGEAQSSQPRSLRREITQYRPEPEGLVVRMGEHSKHFVCAGRRLQLFIDSPSGGSVRAGGQPPHIM